MARLDIPTTEFKIEFEPGNVANLTGEGSDVRERDLLMVPIDRISPVKDFNVRVHDPEYEAHIETIKDKIIREGFHRHLPLKCYVGKEGDQDLFYLVGGYTRFEAAKRAKAEGANIERLPVVVTPKGVSMKDLMYGIDTDNDGKNLTPFERAILCKRLVAMDESEDEIAKGMGISKQYVSDLLSLMAAPRALHNMVTSGEVSARLAMDTIRKEGSGKKAVEVLKGAGATGESPTPPTNGSGEQTNRVTRTSLGITAAAGKKLYEALVEYLIVLNGSSGAQAAMDFLLRWNEKEAAAVKELEGIVAKGGKKAKEKKPNPKDVRIKLRKDMTDEERAKAKAHNKEVKKRAERREKKAAKAAAAAGENKNNDDDPL